MPRARKQPVQTAAGQAYGVAGEQKAAMSQVPLANNSFTPAASGAVPPPAGSPAPPAAAGAPAPTPGAPAPVDPMEQAVQAALAMTPPSGSVFGETARPDEPLTHGLPSGPGGGSEVLGLPRANKPTPTADAFEALARNNANNPVLARLAAEARMRGV